MLQHTFTRTAAALSTLALSASAFAEEVVENPYGLSALWAQGDVVAKATLLILVIMSMGSWYVIFTKLAEQNRVMRYAATAQNNFWNAGDVRQGTDGLEVDSPFRFIAEKVWRAQASTPACWATSTSISPTAHREAETAKAHRG